MQFFTCYEMVFRRGFFIHQNLIYYDSPVFNAVEHKDGFPKKQFWKCALMWFSLHKNFSNFNIKFLTFGDVRASMFGYMCLFIFSPNKDFISWYKYNLVRLYKLRTFKGRRIAQKFPANGQRTRSNSSKNNLKKKLNQQLLWK